MTAYRALLDRFTVGDKVQHSTHSLLVLRVAT